jgi:rhodanese-related sulfurtransferase
MDNYDVKLANEFFRARVAFTTGVHEVERMIADGTAADYQVVDVRYAPDFDKSHIPGAINLPKPAWRRAETMLADVSKDKTLYLYCYTPTCHLAAEAAVELTALGYKVVEIEGGWERWQNDGFSVEEAA